MCETESATPVPLLNPIQMSEEQSNAESLAPSNASSENDHNNNNNGLLDHEEKLDYEASNTADSDNALPATDMANPVRFTGTLRCFSSRLGYGFVQCDDTGENLLFPGSNFACDTTDLDLSAEWPVEFEIVEGPRGLEASSLMMLNSWPQQQPSQQDSKTEDELLAVDQQEPKEGEEPTETQLEPVVFEYDNVLVQETDPEPLLLETPTQLDKQPSKRQGKESGITCRVKWFNCKKWHGALYIEPKQQQQNDQKKTQVQNKDLEIFVRLDEAAIDVVKKRNVTALDPGCRVQIDIDWSVRKFSEADGGAETAVGQKTPPYLITDLKLLEKPSAAAGGDLRSSLSLNKLKESNGSGGVGSAIKVTGQAGVRSKPVGLQNQQMAANRKRMGDGQTGGSMNDLSKTKKLSNGPTTMGGKPIGSWRGGPNKNFAASKSGPANMKRGPPPPSHQPPQQRFAQTSNSMSQQQMMMSRGGMMGMGMPSSSSQQNFQGPYSGASSGAFGMAMMGGMNRGGGYPSSSSAVAGPPHRQGQFGRVGGGGGGGRTPPPAMPSHSMFNNHQQQLHSHSSNLSASYGGQQSNFFMSSSPNRGGGGGGIGSMPPNLLGGGGGGGNRNQMSPQRIGSGANLMNLYNNAMTYAGTSSSMQRGSSASSLMTASSLNPYQQAEQQNRFRQTGAQFQQQQQQQQRYFANFENQAFGQQRRY